MNFLLVITKKNTISGVTFSFKYKHSKERKTFWSRISLTKLYTVYVAVGKQRDTDRKSEVLLKDQRRLFTVNGLYSFFLRLETRESETKSPKRKLSHETHKAAPITETKLAKFYNHAIQSHTSPSSSVCYIYTMVYDYLTCADIDVWRACS